MRRETSLMRCIAFLRLPEPGRRAGNAFRWEGWKDSTGVPREGSTATLAPNSLQLQSFSGTFLALERSGRRTHEYES